MPDRIIVLYVILCLRVLVNGAAIVKLFPPSSGKEEFAFVAAAFEFAVFLLMLIALYNRKKWTILVFRLYIGIILPLSFGVMCLVTFVNSRNGAGVEWVPLIFSAFLTAGLLLFAWYVGGGLTREYLKN